MRFLAIVFLFVSPCFGWQLPDAPKPVTPTFAEEIAKQPRYEFQMIAPSRTPEFDFNKFADHWMTRIEKHAPTEAAIARRMVKDKHGVVRAIGKGMKVQRDHLPVEPRPF